MNQKAIIITHPHEYFDVNRSIEYNLESFVNENKDYDIIRLMDKTLDNEKRMFDNGEIILSRVGEIHKAKAEQIIRQYSTIVTAGGFFYNCALKTFQDLTNYKRRGPNRDLRIVIPLDLHYINFTDEDYNRKSRTMEEHYSLHGVNLENLDIVFRLYALNLQKSHKKIPLRRTKSNDIKMKLQDNKVLMKDFGLRIEGVASYKEMRDL